MGTHRRPKAHPYRNAIVCTAAAGGLIMTGTPAGAAVVVSPGSATPPTSVDSPTAGASVDERTVKAIGFAAEQVINANDGWFYACQRFVRTALGTPADARSAIASWRQTPARYRHTSANPPAGVPVYWAPNHVALSAGDGYVYSNDILRKGQVNFVPIDLIEKKWGLKPLGWASWMNGVALNVAQTDVDPTAGLPGLNVVL
ncbi:MAG TPA: hypothetical protein VE081_14680 [Sporichthyaceae bacterium]|nr:hypothetical protein [Sporichthyaceae bacterium]